MTNIRLLALSLLAISLTTLTAQAGRFTDVRDQHRFSKSIEFLATQGVISGNPDGTFAPGRTLNRAEFAKLLVGIVESTTPAQPNTPCFDDVPINEWYAPFVCRAKELNFVKGDGGEGKIYRPADTLNVVEAMAALKHAFAWQLAEDEGAWYQPLLSKASTSQLFADNYKADDTVNRGMIADIISRSYVLRDLDKDSFSGYADLDTLLTADNNPLVADPSAATTETVPAVVSEEPATVDFNNTESIVAALIQDYYEGEKRYADYLDVDEDELGINAFYKVTGDDIYIQLTHNVKAGLHSDQVEEIWEIFSTLIPYKYRLDVSYFVMFSDGPSHMLAAVVDAEKYMSKTWMLGIDYIDAYPDGAIDKLHLTYAMIHETGHIITLGRDQIPLSPYLEGAESATEYNNTLADLPRKCAEDFNLIYSHKGCANTDSYVSLFYDKFWKNIAEDWAVWESKDLSDTAVQDALYAQFANTFMTSYAGTRLEEDLAETFVAFVLRDKPTDTSTIVNQKILFYWDYPELVTLRSTIRENLPKALNDL
jgi:hypothetical protein